MSSGRVGLIPPPRWTDKDLENDRSQAIAAFRKQRMEEPLEAYLEAFDHYKGIVQDLLEKTVDLSELDENAFTVLGDRNLMKAFRYLSGPPISFDDLKTLVGGSLSGERLRTDAGLVKRVLDTVKTGLDRRRFPWIPEGRQPSAAERNAAALASAAMMATQALGTRRRNEGKTAQERQVRDALLDFKFTQVETRRVMTLGDAPKPGEFCMESLLGERKADLIVGLWDGRTMPIEAKVSNSATNSIKRLNNDAAAKAEYWVHAFGASQVLPTAVLSGVYKLNNLENAQERDLTLFWAHRLKDLTDFIGNTKKTVRAGQEGVSPARSARRSNRSKSR